MRSPSLSFIERKRHDLRLGGAAADIDVDLAAWRRESRGNVCHPDGLPQEWRLRAARDPTDGLTGAHDRIPLPRNAALEHLEANQGARGSALFLLEQAV